MHFLEDNIFFWFTFNYFNNLIKLSMYIPIFWTSLHQHIWTQARIQKFFKGGGGLRNKILKEKCLLIDVSTRVHMKTRQTCNSFSLLPFLEDCLLFLALFYYSLSFLKFERVDGVKKPVTPLPPLDPPMQRMITL